MKWIDTNSKNTQMHDIWHTTDIFSKEQKYDNRLVQCEATILEY